jgi:hypothetical protein
MTDERLPKKKWIGYLWKKRRRGRPKRRCHEIAEISVQV